MTSRERVIKTLLHQPVDRTPRDLWVSPEVETRQGDEVAELRFRYPCDMIRPDFCAPGGARAKGAPREAGQYVDAWGCVWQVSQPGAAAQLKQSPLADLRHRSTYRPPWELLDPAHFVRVNPGCARSSQFVLAWTEVEPFRRLQALRGIEATKADLAYGSKAIREVLRMVHDFFLREMEMWTRTEVDGVAFMDAWGQEQAMPLAPDAWRELFKPLYRDYCTLLHDRDKFAFFRCDEPIVVLLDDLIEIGVDAIHTDLGSLDIESAAARYRGRITLWGVADGQRSLVFGTPEDVRAAIQRLRKAWDFGRGGVIAQCAWTPGVRFENVAAAFEQWLAPAITAGRNAGCARVQTD